MKIIVTLILLLSYLISFCQDTTKFMISIKTSNFLNDFGLSYTSYFHERSAISFDIAIPINYYFREYQQINGVVFKTDFEYKLKQKKNYPFIQAGIGGRYINIKGIHQSDDTSETYDIDMKNILLNINWGYSFNIKHLNISFAFGLSPGYKNNYFYNRVLEPQNNGFFITGENYNVKGFLLRANTDLSIGYKF